MVFRVYKGRKINKILCLSFFVLTLIFLITAGILALVTDSSAGYTFCLLALITGGFSLLYGIFWFIYGRIEKKTERELQEIFEGINKPDDPYRLDYREFILPKADLIKKAGERARSIVRWTGVFALGTFLLISGIQLIYGALRNPLQLLYILLFCVLIMIPGILIHLCLYFVYDQSVPARIMLYPGKLIVDNASLSAREIQAIRVSPARIFNLNSPDVFREMLIRTEKSSVKLRIDYRTGTVSNEQPFWEEYGTFIAALSEWGVRNNVPVTISFMS